MFKSMFVFSALFAAALAQYAFEDNYVGYEVPVHVRKNLMPYVYAEKAKEAVLTPVLQKLKTGSIPAESLEIVSSKLSLVASVVSFAVGLVKKVITLLIVKGPALGVGSLLALAICKFTPLCHKLSSIANIQTLIEAQHELRTLATPERISRAANFVQNAMKKFTDMQ